MSMKRFALLLLLLPCATLPARGGDTKYPTFGTIERKDPRFDKLLPKNAKLEQLADGFAWTEGPVWVKAGGYFLFSDIPNNVVNKWQEGKGVTKFLFPAGYTGSKVRTGKGPGDEPGSNGLRIDAKGRLVLCEHGDRRVTRLDVPLTADTKPMIGAKNVKKTVLADKYTGKRLNSPNDLVYDRAGNLYFTDPPYGLLKNVDDPARELNFQGVYRLSADGKLTLLTRAMSRPNGIGLSPDEKTLYVANSDPARPVVMAFPLASDGTLGKGKVLLDSTLWVKQMKPGLPDGLKIDVQGNVWATGPGGVHVIAPDGTHLGSILTNDRTSNCAFGGDGSTLYLTVNHRIARIRTSTKGLGY